MTGSTKTDFLSYSSLMNSKQDEDSPEKALVQSVRKWKP